MVFRQIAKYEGLAFGISVRILCFLCSVDCSIVSLHELYLYDTPLKLTLDHAQ